MYEYMCLYIFHENDIFSSSFLSLSLSLDLHFLAQSWSFGADFFWFDGNWATSDLERIQYQSVCMNANINTIMLGEYVVYIRKISNFPIAPEI